MLESLSAVVEAEENLVQRAATIATAEYEQLRIGTYSSVSVNLLPKLLNGFKEQYPEVSISITVGNQIKDWLDKDIADVLIGVERNDHVWLPLINDDFVAVVPEELFPEKQVVHCEELYPYPFITTQNLTVPKSFDMSRFKELIHITAEDDMSAVSMVQAGMGVTILPALVLKKKTKGVRTIAMEPCLHRTIGVSYKNGLPTSSGAMKFVKYLQKNL